MSEDPNHAVTPAENTTRPKPRRRLALIAAAVGVVVIAGAAVGITLAVTHHSSSSSPSEAVDLSSGNPPMIMTILGCDPSTVVDQGQSGLYNSEQWQCTETLSGSGAQLTVFIWADPGYEAAFVNRSLQTGENGVYGSGWFVRTPPTAVQAAALDAGGTQVN